jgi:hypothetical protein
MDRPRHVLLELQAPITLREAAEQLVGRHGNVADVRRANDENDVAVWANDSGSPPRTPAMSRK